MKNTMTLKELKANRARLAKIQLKEYTTRGNTQRCQELWAEIEKLDADIKAREGA